MLFSSITFLYYFLPVTCLLYQIVPQKAKNGFLLAVSLFFYFWGEPRYVLLMAGMIFLGYTGGRLLEHRRKKWILAGVVLAVFLPLLLFKYADFAVGTWNDITQGNLAFPALALPVGISFYTFQVAGYLVDVYRGEIKAERSLIDFGAYVAMFPQLIAGPIVRYRDIRGQLKRREGGLLQLSRGIPRFLCGLGKKVLIADMLGELIGKLGTPATPFFHWVLAAIYVLQIYYDFSGYSDMAIGLGTMFGFRFPENFDYPLIAKSITEFWRRWHKTLGSWFRDYVYIPLGGNRVPLLRWACNVMLVWTASGLWHGAGWNFALWGAYFGIFLMIEKLFLGKILNKLPPFFSHLYALTVVTVSFVLFRLENPGELAAYLGSMFGIGKISETGGSMGTQADAAAILQTVYELKSDALLLLTAVLGATPLPRRLYKTATERVQRRGHGWLLGTLFAVSGFAVLILVTASLIGSSVHPFLYFRF